MHRSKATDGAEDRGHACLSPPEPASCTQPQKGTCQGGLEAWWEHRLIDVELAKALKGDQHRHTPSPALHKRDAEGRQQLFLDEEARDMIKCLLLLSHSLI